MLRVSTKMEEDQRALRAKGYTNGLACLCTHESRGIPIFFCYGEMFFATLEKIE